MVSAVPIIPATVHTKVRQNVVNRAERLRQANAEPSTNINQVTKLEATGKAMRWQGYAARLGLGTTRTRNQTSEASPIPEPSQAAQLRFREGDTTRPVTGQIRDWLFFKWD